MYVTLRSRPVPSPFLGTGDTGSTLPSQGEQAGLGTDGTNAGWSGLQWAAQGRRDSHTTCSQVLFGLRNCPGSSAHTTSARSAASPTCREGDTPADRPSRACSSQSPTRQPGVYTFMFPITKCCLGNTVHGALGCECWHVPGGVCSCICPLSVHSCPSHPLCLSSLSLPLCLPCSPRLSHSNSLSWALPGPQPS